MKGWVPWAIAAALLALVLLERWDHGRTRTEIDATDREIAVLDRALATARRQFEVDTVYLRRRLAEWPELRAGVVAARPTTPPALLPLLDRVVAYGNSTTAKCSAVTTTCGELVAQERKRGDLWELQAHRWERIADGPWIQPSLTGLVSPAGAVRGEVEVRFLRGDWHPLLRGTAEADLEGTETRLWVGMTRTF